MSKMTIELILPEKTATIYCIADLDGYRGVGGVYCAYSETGKLLYIGKTKCFKSRVGAHLSGSSDKKEISHLFHYVDICEVKNEADREIYETYMINKLKPLYNKDKVYFSRKKKAKVVDKKPQDNQTSNTIWLAQLGLLPPEDIEEYKRIYGKEAI